MCLEVCKGQIKKLVINKHENPHIILRKMLLDYGNSPRIALVGWEIAMPLIPVLCFDGSGSPGRFGGIVHFCGLKT
jgi:hypothetical protein